MSHFENAIYRPLANQDPIVNEHLLTFYIKRQIDLLVNVHLQSRNENRPAYENLYLSCQSYYCIKNGEQKEAIGLIPLVSHDRGYHKIERLLRLTPKGRSNSAEPFITTIMCACTTSLPTALLPIPPGTAMAQCSLFVKFRECPLNDRFAFLDQGQSSRTPSEILRLYNEILKP